MPSVEVKARYKKTAREFENFLRSNKFNGKKERKKKWLVESFDAIADSNYNAEREKKQARVAKKLVKRI